MAKVESIEGRRPRIGLLGCGSVAEFGHLPAIRATPGLELVALYDPILPKAESSAAKFGGIGTSDIDQFFGQNLDAIVVASPAPVHRDNVMMAATHGVHVLCEKPIAMTDDEGEEMIAAMANAGKHLATGFVYRYSPVAQQIRKWIREGIAGEIRSLRLIYAWNLHGQWEQDAKGNWVESPRWRGRMEEGGPMVDCGVHQIDLARWWLGKEVVELAASGAWVADYEAPDHMYLHLDHEGGAHSMVEMSFSYGHTAKEPAPIFSYDLIGTGGVIRYDRNGWRTEVRHGQGTIVGPTAGEKNFDGMYHAFLNALHTGDWSEMPTAQDGLVATKIAREATDHLSLRRSLKLPQNKQEMELHTPK